MDQSVGNPDNASGGLGERGGDSRERSKGRGRPTLPISSRYYLGRDGRVGGGNGASGPAALLCCALAWSRRPPKWASCPPAPLHRPSSVRPWALARSDPLASAPHSSTATVAREQPTALTHPALRRSMALLL